MKRREPGRPRGARRTASSQSLSLDGVLQGTVISRSICPEPLQ